MRNDYQGSILMDNKEVKTISIAEWALIRRERISIVMQDMRLIPTLTVEDNLNLKNNLKK
ncbi:MAG TPA: ABC transporter ATP-binding protein, partial [Flavobacteriales bacterium]|nr:ABC transporter ATP-binding protein [Flavobacteriales bacterium]